MDNLISFLSGIIIGATGSYFGNKYTDRRREQEAKSKEKQQFLEVVGMMPDLISEMKNDLSKPEQKLIREFFLTKRAYSLNPGNLSFVYYEDDHPGLHGKIHVLENLGYVTDITPGNAPMYRMTEDFVKLVLNEESASLAGAACSS